MPLPDITPALLERIADVFDNHSLVEDYMFGDAIGRPVTKSNRVETVCIMGGCELAIDPYMSCFDIGRLIAKRVSDNHGWVLSPIGEATDCTGQLIRKYGVQEGARVVARTCRRWAKELQ